MPSAPWLHHVQMQVYVARYCNQAREGVRAMPLSTFYAWFFAATEMIRRETTPNE